MNYLLPLAVFVLLMLRNRPSNGVAPVSRQSGQIVNSGSAKALATPTNRLQDGGSAAATYINDAAAGISILKSTYSSIASLFPQTKPTVWNNAPVQQTYNENLPAESAPAMDYTMPDYNAGVDMTSMDSLAFTA